MTCEHTGLSIPECCCLQCLEAMVANISSLDGNEIMNTEVK